MKIRLVAIVLVAGAGCASPKLGDRSLGETGPDLSTGGVGSNGSVDDMAMADVVDLAMATPDVVDMAESVVDMAKPPLPVVDMAQPPVPDMTVTCHPPAGSACSISAQCGCAAGQACDIDASGNGLCRLAGTIPDWNVCPVSGNNCSKGSTCINGVCTPLCSTVAAPSSQCGAATECYQGPVIGTPVPNGIVCSANCDPAAPQSPGGTFAVTCGPNTNCLPTSDSQGNFTGYAYCAAPVTAAGGDHYNCYTSGNTDQTKCKPGFICLTDATGSKANTYCSQQCHVGASNACSIAGQTCTGYKPAVKVNGVQIGYCI